MTPEEKRIYAKHWRETHKDQCKAHYKKWRSKNKEALKVYRHKWRKSNPEKYRRIQTNTYLKKTYGITSTEYNQILLSQNGRCAICSKPVSEFKRNLHVDHSHITGENRGLLCVKCNTGIGCFDENPHLLEKAKTYLKHFNHSTTL